MQYCYYFLVKRRLLSITEVKTGKAKLSFLRGAFCPTLQSYRLTPPNLAEIGVAVVGKQRGTTLMGASS